MRSFALALALGLAFFVTPIASHGQEIGAREGDRIEVEADGKSDHVSVRSTQPIRVEIVAPDPPPDKSYGDFELVIFKPDPRPKATAADFKALTTIPEAGLFRVRVTYAKPPKVTHVPVTMLVGPPTVEQPFPFQAKPTKKPKVYMTRAIHLNAPIRDLMTLVASRGDEITAEVGGVRGSARVTVLPDDGIIPDRGLLSQRQDPKPLSAEIDCSCKSVTLNRIRSRVYTGSSGAKIFENTWHYKDSVEFQLGDFSNPPERGKVVIPWKKDGDVMQFYFTFPQALAYIVADGKQHLCRVVVELEYPHPRRRSGNITETFRLYSKQGMAMGTASRNMIARAANGDPKQKGAGRIRWSVENSGYCSDGVPFLIR